MPNEYDAMFTSNMKDGDKRAFISNSHDSLVTVIVYILKYSTVICRNNANSLTMS